MALRTALTAIFMALPMLACDTGSDDAVPLDQEVQGVETEAAPADRTDQTFMARFSALNAHLLDSTPSGEATVEVRGDSLIVTVDATGLPPGMPHLQHFHGFEDGSAARCPGADADENGDGIIDVTETAAMAGTTMVPFHGDPTTMEIDADTYPRADDQGAYTYRHAVALQPLRSAFQEKFGGDLDLSRRVVFIHGVPADHELPETVETKAGLPAHATLPIACGSLEPTSGAEPAS